MKKTISMLLLLILTLSVCCAYAEDGDAQIAAHSVAAIQQRGTLRVALQSGNSKMSYRSENIVFVKVMISAVGTEVI